MPIRTFGTEGSSRVTGMAYNTEKHTLRIEFKRGGTYVYEEVPEEIYDQLITSPSIGKAINQLIIGSEYKYTKA